MREVMLRERAELENQRKRLQRDLEQARRFANEKLLADLLPVLDSLERGLALEGERLRGASRRRRADAARARARGRRQRAQGRRSRSASRSIPSVTRR